MSNTTRSEKKAGQSELPTNNRIDSAFDFDLWAGAVRQQMLAALKRRERMRNV